MAYKYIKWLDEITMEDLPLVGGKNASLGEMYNALTPKGINIPYALPLPRKLIGILLTAITLGRR